jgi:hypothetical protein
MSVRAVSVLALGPSIAHAGDLAGKLTADCWERISDQAKLWRCHAQALPDSAKDHSAARLQTLVIATGSTLWILDPGATAAQGKALAQALLRPDTSWTNKATAKATTLWVINSRAQAEHVMAGDELIRLWPGKAHFVALPQTANLMRQRCTPCGARLERELGKAAMRGTRIRIPDPIPVDAPELRPALQLREAVSAAIESDAWAIATDGRWVWVGVLLSNGLPDLQSGLLDARIATLEQLASAHAQYPHAIWLNTFGRISPHTIAAQLAYFQQLRSAAKSALDQGADSLGALDALRRIDSPIALSNAIDRQTHDLNLQRIVRQQEDALLNDKP